MKKLVLVFVFIYAFTSFTSISSSVPDEVIQISNDATLEASENENLVEAEVDLGICNGHSIDQTFVVVCSGEISLIYEATICSEHLEAWNDIFMNWC